jgi:dynein heavy chain
VLQVNVINFTVTRSGLEEQLLSDVVSKEKPDIENRKNRLLISMAADKKQLRVSVATPPPHACVE